MKLTSARLFKAMELGKSYQARDLASQFEATTGEVKDMLCTLVEDGKVRMNSQTGRVLRFERSENVCGPEVMPEPVEASAPAPLQTSVATQLVTRTFTGSLEQYDATLMQVQRLAMLTRRYSSQ